ncbi:hypothetical protein [Bradyrhizobium sp. USDA 4369]
MSGLTLDGYFSLNDSKYSFDISQNIVVPEAKDAIAFVSEPTIANDIPDRFAMLPTINLDYQRSFPTDEIADVSRNGTLPNKLMALQLAVADPVPQDRFRVCLVNTEAPCPSDRFEIWAPHVPCPSPGLLRNPTSPREGRGEVALSVLREIAPTT